MTNFTLPSCCSRCLAEEAAQSWPVRAETREPHPCEEGKVIITYYWTQVPVCQKCRGELSWLCCAFWLVGAMAGVMTAMLLALYLPRPETFGNTPMWVDLSVATAVVLFVACAVAAACRWLLDASVATYDPHQSRLRFGNRQYQARFDQLNSYLPRGRRSTLGV